MSFRPEPPFLLSQESTGAEWRNLANDWNKPTRIRPSTHRLIYSPKALWRGLKGAPYISIETGQSHKSPCQYYTPTRHTFYGGDERGTTFYGGDKRGPLHFYRNRPTARIGQAALLNSLIKKSTVLLYIVHRKISV